jgi:hypothetical protein
MIVGSEGSYFIGAQADPLGLPSLAFRMAYMGNLHLIGFHAVIFHRIT